ncbi:hypothetical protein FHS96_003993 [Sphingomonas zeicaulis]|uniref:hypothetical protein n=1 Tax=Sphingomonas zeicaulis TaxID=1632740 RepID=UPI003D202D69
MAVTPHIVPESIPATSLVFGFGSMVPLAVAAVGAWTMPPPWPLIAVELGILCAAIILIFVGGVRRGFGFGNPASSTRSQIRAVIVYVGLGGLALLAARVDETVIALCLVADRFCARPHAGSSCRL